MLVAIISDIHDNLVTLKTCLDWCLKKEIQKLIICGDITTLETITYLTRAFTGEIFVVAGNAEIYEEEKLTKFKNLKYFGAIGVFSIAEVNIGLCHEPVKIKKVQAAATAPLDFIFYGHSHKPWIEKENGTYIVNPGNLAGDINPATFAVLDTTDKRISLKILSQL
ncbi:MAG: YfcE family phosphodiesterase [Patescibacteria group bacterium]